MQVQFNKTAIRCLGTALQEVRNAEVTQELRLSDGMPDIGRVLTTWGQVLIRSKEWRGSDITLTGGVKAWTLYAPEDGTEPRSVESWIPFQITWKSAEVEREGPVRVIPLLRFADSRSISSRKMIVRAGVAALAQALYPRETVICAPEELPDDVQILRKAYPMRIPVESGEKTFLVDEELTLPESGASIDKLLAVMVCPEIAEKRILSDKVVFKGNLAMHMVCRTKEGRVTRVELAQPFSQLSELDRSYDGDAQADIQMAVTSLDTDLGENGIVRMKCGLAAQYLVDEKRTLELIQDGYSPYRAVTPVEGMLELPVILADRTETMQAEVTVPGQEGTGADVLFLPDFPRERTGLTGADLELPGVFQTLIYGENESLQGSSARWEGKLQYPAEENVNLLTSIQSAGSARSLMTSEGLALAAPLRIQMMASAAKSIPMVSSMEIGQIQELDPSRPSVIICNCKGNSLWELAKIHGSTVNAIRSANNITEDYVSAGMLLIPVI